MAFTLQSPLFITNGVDPPLPYSEVIEQPASPRGTLTTERSRVTRTYLIAWSDLDLARRVILGYPYLDAGGDFRTIGKFLKRALPHGVSQFDARTSALLPNGEYLYASSLDFDPWGLPPGREPNLLDISGTVQYAYAKLSVTYDTRSYEIEHLGNATNDLDAFRYITIHPTPTAQHLSLPGGRFQFVPDPPLQAIPVPGTPGKIEGKTRIALTWHEVPRDAIGIRALNPTSLSPVYPLEDYIGCVNSDTFLGYEPGQLLLDAPTLRANVSAIGQRVYDVQFNMIAFMPGHEKLLRVEKDLPLKYLEVSVDGVSHNIGALDGRHIYDARPFRHLFGAG